MKITIEPEEGEKGKAEVYEHVYTYVFVGYRAGPMGSTPIRVSRANSEHIYGLLELLAGMKYRLLPLAEPIKVV